MSGRIVIIYHDAMRSTRMLFAGNYLLILYIIMILTIFLLPKGG